MARPLDEPFRRCTLRASMAGKLLPSFRRVKRRLRKEAAGPVFCGRDRGAFVSVVHGTSTICGPKWSAVRRILA